MYIYATPVNSQFSLHIESRFARFDGRQSLDVFALVVLDSSERLVPYTTKDLFQSLSSPQPAQQWQKASVFLPYLPELSASKFLCCHGILFSGEFCGICGIADITRWSAGTC